MANKIKGITIEIGGNTTKLDNALQGVNKTIYACNTELKDLNKALKLDPTNTELLAQKQDVLKKSIEASTSKLKDLKTAQQQMGSYNKLTEEQKEQYRALSVEIVKTESSLKNLNSELKETNKAKFEGLHNGLKKTGEIASKVVKSIAAVGAAVTAAAAGTAKALFDSANAVSEYGDAIDKESQKLNLSAENYQKLDYAMQSNGATIDSLSAGMKKIVGDLGDFSNGTKKAEDKYKSLGVSLKNTDGTLKSSEQVLFESINALSNMEDVTKRNALAQDIFGKGAAELMPLLNAGSESFNQLMEEAEKYGMVMSDDTVSASAAFNDSLTRLQKTAGGVKNKLVGTLLPGMTKLMDGFSGLLVGSEDASETIKEGISSIAESIQTTLPTIIESITNMIPILIPVINQILTTIVQVLADNLPMIIKSGMDLLLSLILGISKMLPDLVPVIIDCVLTIVDTLLDNLDLLIDAAIQLMIGIGSGLIKGIPKILEKIPEIIAQMVKSFVSLIPELFKVGEQLLDGLLDGLKNIGTKIWDAVKSVGSKIKDGFCNFFGIHSPSKLMADQVGSFIGEGVTEGIIEGIEETENKVNTAMKQLASGIETSVNPTINPTANTNPLIIQIENFINNRESDIQTLAQELEFYRRNNALAKGGN